jgi:hypothetical protein
LQLGAILVTTPPSTGTPTPIASLAINGQAGLSVNIGPNSENLGVNWTLSCEGSPVPVPNPAPSGYTNPDPNPCGTVSNTYGSSTVYTAPPLIPVGASVNIKAASASDPSISSTVVLPIEPLPVTIAISPPQTIALGVNGTAPLSATVSSDPTAAGVLWSLSCGSAAAGACGSLQSGLPNPNQTASTGQITYTAPAAIPPGGVVTITAASVADPTKSKQAMATIAPISIGVLTPTVTVPILTIANLTATVSFDASNKGVTWGAPTCAATGAGACGTLSTTHTASGGSVIYSAPTSIPTGATVTVVASATANPSATAPVTITIAPPPPIAVSVAPLTALVQTNGKVSLTATETFDLANAGSDWTLTCGSTVAGACGSLTAHTASGTANLYTAPPAIPTGGVVTATATSTTDHTKTGTSTITVEPTISIAFTPAATTSTTAGTATSYTATVTNDVAAAGVDWTASCSAPPCGTFSPAHTASGAATMFTAPVTAPAGTVTVMATSTASNTALPVRSISATVTVIPVIAVTFVPFPPTQMQVSNQLSGLVTSAPIGLTAAVSNDSTNAGVDWSVCGSASSCGEFQVTPAIAATSTTAAVNAVYAATLHTASGQVAFYVPPSQPPEPSGTVAITAKAHNPAATSSAATATATINVVAIPSAGVQLNGVVMAGAKPVSGAAVSLYAAGTAGYSSAASLLQISGSATQVSSAANGQFTIPAGYTCPSQSSLMYLVALGGNAGGGVNPNLAMMTALGPCGGLSSAANIAINEVTTIASVWPLAPFMSDYAHVGSSSANLTAGLANAFAAVNNLVNISTGLALKITPVGNGTVPQSEIDTLADVLNTCTITAGGAVGDGSACAALFNVANPGAIVANAPTNTLQAALNIAGSPSNNTSGIATVFGLLPANPSANVPFLPILGTAPNDWTISISFTGGGLGGTSRARSQSTGFAIDALGNIWIADNGINSVTELNSLGAPLSPPTASGGTTLASAGGFKGGGLSSPVAVAVDPLGNAWVANGNGTLSALSPTGSAVSPSAGYSGGGLTSSVGGLAIDGLGNIWTANDDSPGSVSWFAGTNATINGTATPAGTPLSPSTGITQGINTPTGAVGIDNSGTVWVLNAGTNTAAELASSTGSFIQSDFGYQQSVPVLAGSVLAQGVGQSLAIDSAGDVFTPEGSPPGFIAKLIAGGSSANGGGLGTTLATVAGVNYSTFLALDGANHFWLVGSSTNCTAIASSVVEISGSGALLNTNSQLCGYAGAGVSASSVAIAIDGSGDVWVLSGGSVTEFIGVASPVVTPFSLGVQNKTLGKKP